MKSKTLIDAVQGVTNKWAKQRKQEERNASARANRYWAMVRERRTTMIEAAGEVLPKAWAMASGDGQYPASARQIFYAARGPMQEFTDKPVAYNYFSQTLLPDYIERNRLDWDVVYDARGNFHEPHTDKTVPLGTLQVRGYLRGVSGYVRPQEVPSITIDTAFPTTGPSCRFGAVLFIEKEGFKPLLEKAKIAERFDIAIMSTKGMSVTASRTLAEDLCAGHGIPLLVLHDFDVSGFTIAGTLQRSTRRFQFTSAFRVIDLGLRLADAEDMGLEAEDVHFDSKSDLSAKAYTLRLYGATEEEISFLLDQQQRVELNAMTSPQFVTFLERKLGENGISKVVPDIETLRLAARRAAMIARIQRSIDEVTDEGAKGDVVLPDDLDAQLRAGLAARPERTWDDLLVEIMGGRITDRDDDEDRWDDDYDPDEDF